MYSIVETLGSGAEGTVFLVKNGAGKKYAMKVMKFFNVNAEAAEKEFNEKVAKKHPERFMRMVTDHGILLRAEDVNLIPGNVAKIVVYDFVDTSLATILMTLKHEAVRSILMQILDAVQIMRNAGFAHGDLHPGNVGIDFTTKKMTKLSNGMVIPTYGFNAKILDYGFLQSRKHRIADKSFFSWLMRHEGTAIAVSTIWPSGHLLFGEEKARGVLEESEPDKKHNKILSEFTTDKWLKRTLFKILFNRVYLDKTFGVDYPSRVFPHTLPIADLLFIVKANGNYDSVMSYLNSRLRG